MEEERRRKRECGCRILTNFLRRKVSLKKKRWAANFLRRDDETN
jgi:hypothetical protein